MAKKKTKKKLPRAKVPKPTRAHKDRKRACRYDPSNPDRPEYDQGFDEMAYP